MYPTTLKILLPYGIWQGVGGGKSNLRRNKPEIKGTVPSKYTLEKLQEISFPVPSPPAGSSRILHV
jgi:hypothetical protein